MKTIYFSLILLILCSSCKTVRINKQSQKIATSLVELATIGALNSNLEMNDFQIVSIPKYEEKIRAHKVLLSHTKSTLNALKKSFKFLGEKGAINFKDTLLKKSKYASFQLIDVVSVVKQLNNKDNSSVIEHLKIASDAKLVSNISIHFNEQILKDIEKAEEIYLVHNKFKKYDLALYINNSLYKTIKISDGAVFSYKLSSFCWAQNKEEPTLVNLINNSGKCEHKTYSSYEEAIPKRQKIKY